MSVHLDQLLPEDASYMARALQLAAKGLYSTMPNPRVGCLLVKSGQVVGEGWHRKAGEAHAEVVALAEAGEAAVGATVYVSLEPCSHYGRTGPCSEALVAAGVARVVYAMTDPNPNVSGRGIARLLSAGIEVTGPILEKEAWALNPGFIRRMESGRPWVRLKMAMSMDGRTAMADGSSKWITGPAARADVQKLRARSCAIITGIGSVLLDDPSLTVRTNELNLEDAELAASVQPLRVVLDSEQKLPLGAKVLQSPADLIVVSTQSKFRLDIESTGAGFVSLPGANGVDLRGLLDYLAQQRACNEVMVETGATLAGAFLRQGLVDELIIYMAPKLMGSLARPLFELPLESMASSLPLQINDVRMVGSDIRVTAAPDPEA